MPVTSPSYFPPSRGTDQIVGITAGQSQTGARVFLAGQSAGAFSTSSDLILIGDLNGSAGITDANLNGTVGVGSKSLSALKTIVTTASAPGAVVAIGASIAPNALALGSSVFIGQSVAQGWTGVASLVGIASSVMIGHQAYQIPNAQAGLGSSVTASVLIGYQVMKGIGAGAIGVGLAICVDNVIIGSQACINSGNAQGTGAGISNSVVIGQAAGSNMGNGSGFQPTYDIIIGTGSAQDYYTGSQNTIISAQSTFSVSGNISNNVVVGYGASQIGHINNTLIGANIIGPGSGVNGNRCVFIGASSGRTNPAGQDDVLILETNISPHQYALLFGRFDLGNIVLGNSTDAGGTRDIGTAGGTNCTKLLNGTKFSSNLAGGGYFYVVAGALHWVGSSGTDTTLAPA